MPNLIVFAGIAPHPPIMVPEVGGESVSRVRGSIDAMREFTHRIIRSEAETVIIISPHAPLDARAFVAYADHRLTGNFASFDAPEATVDAQLDAGLHEAIVLAANEDGYRVLSLNNLPLDHGTSVPLYFLRRFGWRGRIVGLGYSFLSNQDHVRFGVSIRRAVESIGRKIAFVASGDLSHRLKIDAPAGFEPEAHLFDAQIVAALQSGELQRIAEIDEDLRRKAGECGYRSILVACGAIGATPTTCEVLNYEAPFGVGYLVGQLV